MRPWPGSGGYGSLCAQHCGSIDHIILSLLDWKGSPAVAAHLFCLPVPSTTTSNWQCHHTTLIKISIVSFAKAYKPAGQTYITTLIHISWFIILIKREHAQMLSTSFTHSGNRLLPWLPGYIDKGWLQSSTTLALLPIIITVVLINDLFFFKDVSYLFSSRISRTICVFL